MTNGIAGGASLVDRAKNLLLTPKTEWDRIDAEPMTVQGIFTGWVLILAAIPAVSFLVGQLIFGGITTPFGTFKPPFSWVIATAISMYITSVASVFVLGLVIEALAPTFGSVKDRVQAIKVAAFSFTPSMLAGIFYLVPALMILMIVGLYSLYLLYLGLPKLMKTPQDKQVPYLVTAIIAGIVLMIIVSALSNAIGQAFLPSVTLPGLVT